MAKQRISIQTRWWCLAAACGLVVWWATAAWSAVPLPPFSLPAAVNGAVISSESYRGQAMLVTFFATWCPSCMEEIPTLKAVQAKFHPQGFAVVALSLDEGGVEPVAQLVQRAGINYPVLMADRTTTRDFGNVVAIPTSFLINRDGNVVKKYPGYVPRILLEKDIESVL